jgi:hypothetical protein
MAMMNWSFAPDCDVTHIRWISAFGCGRLVFGGLWPFASTFVSTLASEERRHGTNVA